MTVTLRYPRPVTEHRGTAIARQPWREVRQAPPPRMNEGRGSVLGPDTSRRTRWWEMKLECGHQVERTVRYSSQSKLILTRRARSARDVLSPPKRVRCEFCPSEPTP